MPQSENAPRPREQAEYSSREIASIIWHKRSLVAVITILGSMAAVAVALLLPAKYTAMTTIMPPQQPQSVVAALVGGLGSLNGLGGRDIGLKSPSDMYVGLVRSRSIADAVIQRYDLARQFHLTSLGRARTKLGKITGVESGKDTLITISVTDVDPKRAAAIANCYVEELQKQNSRLATTESGDRKLFFEHQLDAERNSLAESENSLKVMQQKTGALQLTGQVEITIKAIAELQADIASREVLLERMKMGATAANPEVIRTETELTALRNQMRTLEQSQNRVGNPFISPTSAPQVGVDYLRRVRELKYHEALFEVLAKQLEAAKTDQEKEAPVIQVVDPAVVPDETSWPPRLLLCLGGSFASFTAACLFALVWFSASREIRRTPLTLASNPELILTASRSGDD
jgi:tyrosine-protein kinase Etk/Wzc